MDQEMNRVDRNYTLFSLDIVETIRQIIDFFSFYIIMNI